MAFDGVIIEYDPVSQGSELDFTLQEVSNIIRLGVSRREREAFGAERVPVGSANPDLGVAVRERETIGTFVLEGEFARMGVARRDREALGMEITPVGVLSRMLGVAQRDRESFGVGTDRIIALGHATVEREAFGWRTDRLVRLGVSQREIEVFGFGAVLGDLEVALGTAYRERTGSGIFVDILIEGIPYLIASREPAKITVKLKDPIGIPVRLWVADGHRQNFSLLGTYDPSEFPVVIEPVTGNPKVKGAYSVTTVRSGIESTTVGERGISRWTLE